MRRVLPPAVFTGTGVAMAAASMLAPGPALLKGTPRLAGGALAIVGAVITVRASTQFQTVGTNIKTFDDPDHLVTTGLFSWSRNPMYLGFVVTLAGLAIGLGTTTPWIGPVAFAIGSDRVYVRFEEHRMHAVFGSEFDRYRSTVSRWLGRRRVIALTEEASRVR